MGGRETADSIYQTKSKPEFFHAETLLHLWEYDPSHHVTLDSVGNTDILTTSPSIQPSLTHVLQRVISFM